MNKQQWLSWAEVFDSWRVIPRVFFTACFIWVVYTTDVLLRWYVALPKDERGLEAAGFGAIVFTALVGFLKLVFDTYSKNGRDWNQQPIQTTSTTMQQTTISTPPKPVEPE